MDNQRFAYDKRANFELYLKLKGYVEHRMPADNKCFFNSIAAALKGDYSDYINQLSSAERDVRQREVREKVYEHLNANPDHYKDFYEVAGSDQMSKEDLNDALKLQIKEVLDDNCWGGHGSIVACSKIYNKRIIVEKPLGVRHDIGPRENTNGTIYLAHVCNETHYNLLEKTTDAPQPNPQVAALFFDQLLKLQKYEYIFQNYSQTSLVDVLSIGFKKSGQTPHDFKDNAKIIINKRMKIVMEKYLSKMKHRHPDDFENLGQNADIKEVVMSFVNKLLDTPSIDEELLIELSTEIYDRAVTVHRPFDEEVHYKYDGGGLLDAVHLALDQQGFYSVVKKITRQEDDEDEDEVIYIDPKGTKADGDSTELLYILSNVLRNIKSEIVVLFLVSGSFDKETLFEAVETKPKFINLLVAYSNEDLIKIKGDIELRRQFTIYQKKFTMPLNLDLKERVKRVASFLIPPLFCMVNHMTTWNVVPCGVLMKYSVNSFPVILLTLMWETIKDNVLSDVNKIIAANKGLLCQSCTPTCQLAGVQCHFDSSVFRKLATGDQEVNIKSLLRYTNFNDELATLPPVLAEIRRLYEDPQPDNYENLEIYLDNQQQQNQNWSTYMVLHLDGRTMGKYPKDVDNYYDMMDDHAVIKSLYVGKTTDAVIRWSHFVTTTSLSQVFSKTSRLILLRSRKFESPELASKDEAMVIEVITTWMKSWSNRKKNPKFLFLNVRSEYTPLLNFSGTSDPKLWAEFAASNINIINFSPEDTEEFVKLEEFRGNFKKESELEFVEGNFSTRTFKSLHEVYALIRARQP